MISTSTYQFIYSQPNRQYWLNHQVALLVHSRLSDRGVSQWLISDLNINNMRLLEYDLISKVTLFSRQKGLFYTMGLTLHHEGKLFDASEYNVENHLCCYELAHEIIIIEVIMYMSI